MKILCPSTIIGPQKKEAKTAYRLMHYVVKQEVEEGMLLYNTLTCAMALVTHEEAQHLMNLEELIENWFLVPVEHNDKEFCQIVKFGIKMMQPRKKGIRKYTVVTTTGCNARCSYCFEKGTKPINMTIETAEKVAQYIINHHGEYEEVQIDWFGGEPLYNFKVMDRICTCLKEQNVIFFSRITTNGYLFNEKTVEKATHLWNIKKIQITLDGTEDNYNRIKAYVHTNGKSSYQRVLENIRMLLATKELTVQIRINLGYDTLADIWELTKELVERFKEYENFEIYYKPLYELFGPTAKKRTSLQRKAIYEEEFKLEQYIQNMGLNKLSEIHQTKGVALYQCMADSEDAVMIVPDGHLGLCEHHLENRFFGHIDNDEWDWDVIRQSREYCEEIQECDTCAYYPRCYRLKICGVRDICFKELREYHIIKIRNKMIREYNDIKKGQDVKYK